MPKSRPAYPPEYRRRIVDLVRAGRTPESLAKEFEASADSIRKWARQASIDEGQRTDGLTSDEKQELQRLRRENRVPREASVDTQNRPVVDTSKPASRCRAPGR